MARSIILLLLPGLTYASIQIHIKASPKKDQVSASFNGTDSKVIQRNEIDSFNLTDSNLKAAIKVNEGATPSHVFLTSFTPWGDLYTTYNWSQVTRNTEIKEIKIVSVNTEEVTLVKKHNENKLSNDAIFSADLSAGLTLMRYIKKAYNGELLSAESEYNINFDIGMSPPLLMKLESHLHKAYQNKQIFQKIQAESEVKFTLKPAQTAELVLDATKVTIDISVVYETNLSGCVAANYNPKHKGHHFWAYDIKNVMNATGVSHIAKSNDSVSIEYYANLSVYVTDQKTGENILSVPYEYKLDF